MKKFHSFHPNVAKKIGIIPATILYSLEDWNYRVIIDNDFIWCLVNPRVVHQEFQYITSIEIEEHINNLIKAGLLCKKEDTYPDLFCRINYEKLIKLERCE